MTCLFRDTNEKLAKDPRNVARITSTDCDYCGMSLEYLETRRTMVKARRSFNDIDNAKKCAKTKSQDLDNMGGHCFRERKPWRVKDGIV
jgi:hypothetical protein